MSHFNRLTFHFMGLAAAFFLLTFPVSAVCAQQRDAPYEPGFSVYGKDYTAEPYYNMLVRQLMDERPSYFDYTYLRGRYTTVRAYDPIGEKPREALLNQAYTIQISEDEAAVERALERFHGILRQHLGNITVVTQALALSRQDGRFGDSKHLAGVRRGLLTNVIRSGDGQSLSGAYDVVVMEEEPLLLAHLNVDVLHTASRHSGSLYYNIHSVVDRETGEPYTVFVNTTKPLEHLERQAYERSRRLNIPKQ